MDSEDILALRNFIHVHAYPALKLLYFQIKSDITIIANHLLLPSIYNNDLVLIKNFQSVRGSHVHVIDKGG